MNMPFNRTPAIGVSAQDILASHFSLSEIPREITPFDQPGVEGWTSANPHPVLSIGKWTTTDPQHAAEALDAVMQPLRAAGRGFDWMTGPQDHGLLPLLEERGFLQPALSISAMVKQIAADETPDDPAGLTTQMIAGRRDDDVAQIMSEGFDIPEDVGRMYHNAYVTPSALQRTDVYTATVTGSDHPMAIAYQSYIGDGPLVLLRVAATLPEARGRGAYRALIRRRLADAALQGRTYAVVHAYSQGSQTALSDMGFATAGTLELHRWRP